MSENKEETKQRPYSLTVFRIVFSRKTTW